MIARQPRLCKKLCAVLPLGTAMLVQAFNQHGLEGWPGIATIPLIAGALHV